MEIQTISPKEMASVVGVSESSVKRWVDAGRIPVSRTAGGHRRISVPDALGFVRKQGMRIVRPELIGLDDLAEVSEAIGEGLDGKILIDAMQGGRSADVRGLLLQAYVSGIAPQSLFDGPLAEAMHFLGRLHERSEVGIAREHRFTQLCFEAINQIRFLQPAPLPDAPVALGGSPEDDPYLLPNMMASVVLREVGFQDINLGAHLPVSAIRQAVDEFAPRLVWLAVTAPPSVERWSELSGLAAELSKMGIRVAAGGIEAVAGSRRWPASVRVIRSMTELADWASAKTIPGRLETPGGQVRRERRSTSLADISGGGGAQIGRK